MASVASADGGHLGTWKLNDAKSKIAAGAAKNDTVVYTAVIDTVKITVDGTGADGKSVHSEWTGKLDGKEYAVTGDPSSDMRSYVKKDENTLEFTATQGGKVTMTGSIELSKDGKTRTVKTAFTDAKGKKVKSTAVYDRQ
jgi:hypothetical protein